jgi:hypothetical protein
MMTASTPAASHAIALHLGIMGRLPLFFCANRIARKTAKATGTAANVAKRRRAAKKNRSDFKPSGGRDGTTAVLPENCPVPG